MAYWGVEVKPGKPYIHLYDEENGRLHVSQATLGSGSSAKKSIVECKVGDKHPIYLCSFLPEKIETCALNLVFEEDDAVTFSVKGDHSVHLSGFFSRDNEDQDSMGNLSEGDIVETDSEDDYMSYDSDDADDDPLGMFVPSTIPNCGVTIEEIMDDDQTTNEAGKLKLGKKKKKQPSISDDKENSNHQIVISSGACIPVLESEDEDGFPISTNKSKSVLPSNGSKTSDMGQKMNGKTQKKRENDETINVKNLKRKIDSMDQVGDPTRDINEHCHSSSQPDGAFPENDDKKKTKKSKQVNSKESSMPISNIVKSQETETGKDVNPTTEKKKEKKKKKQKKQGDHAETLKDRETVTNEKESVVQKEENSEAKSLQVRSFPNGLVIEELAMGKPAGKKASPGKKVSVHYIGRLKKNGKIFDSNIGRAPFKFRLGIGQVIKGWDVGVNGMRIGDKRRLTIPPAMGYGGKGCGPAIPPNSWLAFDVELVDVN